MGNVISLKPFLPEAPERVAERKARTIPVGTAAKEACVWLYNNDPDFHQMVLTIDKETSVTGKVPYDNHHLVLKVVEYFKNTSHLAPLAEIPQVEGKIGDAIAAWRREENLSRKARLAAAKNNAMIAVKAAE